MTCSTGTLEFLKHPMPTFLTQGLALFAASLILWRLLRFFWYKRDLDNIPGPAPESFVKGNFGQLFDVDSWDFHGKMYDQFGSTTRVQGPLGSPHLYTSDPKALQHIVMKDQNAYEESPSFLAFNALAFGDGLLATLGERHRRQRRMLNPVFSVAHLRHMLPMFDDIAKKIVQALKTKTANGPHEVDLLHWLSRGALEMIGQSGLGYSFDSLEDGAEPHPYSQAVQDLVPALGDVALAREYLLPILVKIGSPAFRRFIIDHIPLKSVAKLRDIIDVLDQTTIGIFKEKKAALSKGDEALAVQVGQSKDIMSILMKANTEAKEEDRLSEKEVLGQMTTFAFAATDTTSNALSRTLHLLSMHPEVQEKLREELLEALQTYDHIPHDDLVALPYLDAVCRESLRLYPPVPVTMRTATKDIVLPLSAPIRGLDGRDMDSIMVHRNTTIFVSILNANKDPALWGPDSSEFRPERWLEPLPEPLRNARIPGVYSNLMTFLGGSRACIGFKFSQLEMKLMLSVFISHFRFSLPEKNIIWEMSGPVSTVPTLEGSPRVPQLVLKVDQVRA